MQSNNADRESSVLNQALRGLVFLVSFVWYPAVQAGFFQDNFIDPDEGYLDTSDWLTQKTGFLPVPIIITEPAVGFGGGLAAVFFHGAVGGEKNAQGRKMPPSISGVAAAATDNGSKLGGVFHFGSWKEDNIRYTGILGAASMNLTFYGLEGGGGAGQDGLKFDIEGVFVAQKLLFRMNHSDWFIGPRQIYLDTQNTFKASDYIPLPGIPDIEFDSRSSGIGIEVLYDSLNNMLSPSGGIKGQLQATWYEPTWGSDTSFAKYRANFNGYRRVHPRWVLGLRADASAVYGDAPFYEYPYIDMRGIKALRYQGQRTVVGEVEARWAVNPRWDLVLFGGGGEADPVNQGDAGEGVIFSKGIGFRYLLARKLGLQVGIDVARGPEETAWYLQVGSAWAR
jgi:hypothetical protein